MSDWKARAGTPLEVNPNDPEEVRRWKIRNLHRLEDDIEDAGKVSGREGLHLLASLEKERAETFKDEVRRRWKEATGGDDLPDDARRIVEQFAGAMTSEAEMLDRQATSATEQEAAGIRSFIETQRGYKAGADATNAKYDDARACAATAAHELVSADVDMTLKKAKIIEHVGRALAERGLEYPHSERVLWRWVTDAGVIPDYVRKPGRR